MLKSRLISLAIVVAIASIAAGCGSSDDGTSGASAPTKAEFIKSAEAVCKRTDKEQVAALRAFEKAHPEADESSPWQEKAVVAAGLPAVQIEAEKLDDLPAPSGDEKEVEAITKGLEEAVAKGTAEPSTMLEKGSAGPFSDVVELAREYGFKACTAPL